MEYARDKGEEVWGTFLVFKKTFSELTKEQKPPLGDLNVFSKLGLPGFPSTPCQCLPHPCPSPALLLSGSRAKPDPAANLPNKINL